VKVSVLAPFTPGCPHREDAWAYVLGRYTAEHPDWEIVVGRSPGSLYSRTAAILDAASRASGDVLVVADADVWCDPAEAATKALGSGWAIPHRLIHRLSPESTEQVYAGADWRTLPLSQDNAQDRRPYVGNEAGTLLVLTRSAFEAAPPDPRFAGWGQEDEAWALALRTLIGKAWRGTADLVHFWHPPQERLDRIRGNQENQALLRRYRQAASRPSRMRPLVAEAAQAVLAG
jgi:hypothetical protein